MHNSYADEIAKLADDTAKQSFGNAPKWTVNFTKVMLSSSETMFKGSKIHKIGELVEKFGGTKKGWLKKKGWDAKGKEWHWYEHHGIGRKGVKPTGFPDPF